MARTRSDIRPRILEAARRRFLAHGVDGATLRGIATDAGTNIGMVYYYFKTKDDLFAAVVEEVYAKLIDDMAEGFAAEHAPEQRVARLFQRCARLDAHEIDVIRLVLREALVSSHRLRRVADRFARGHVPLLFALVTDGAASGRFDAELHPAVMAAAAGLLALFPQVAHHLVTVAGLPVAKLVPSREQVASAMNRVLLHGIAAAPKAASRTRSER